MPAARRLIPAKILKIDNAHFDSVNDVNDPISVCASCSLSNFKNSLKSCGSLLFAMIQPPEDLQGLEPLAGRLSMPVSLLISIFIVDGSDL